MRDVIFLLLGAVVLALGGIALCRALSRRGPTWREAIERHIGPTALEAGRYALAVVVFVAALLSVVRDSTGGALLLTIGIAVAGAALLAVTGRSA